MDEMAGRRGRESERHRATDTRVESIGSDCRHHGYLGCRSLLASAVAAVGLRGAAFRSTPACLCQGGRALCQGADTRDSSAASSALSAIMAVTRRAAMANSCSPMLVDDVRNRLCLPLAWLPGNAIVGSLVA